MQPQSKSNFMQENNNTTEEIHSKKLSVILARVFDPSRPETKLETIVNELDHHGMAIMLILFAIPAALPVPAAGYSTALSIPLFIMGLRFFIGYENIWLPDFVAKKTFKPSSFKSVLGKMIKLSKLFEKFSKPRFVRFARSALAKRMIAILIILCSFSMFLPIPGTNTLPAGGIFILGFAMLEDDGLFMLGGFVYSVGALIISTLVIFFGYEAVKALITSIF